MPLDLGHDPAGQWLVDGGRGRHVRSDGHVAHWATCLYAASHRRSSGAQGLAEQTAAPSSPSEPSSNLEAPGGPSVEIEWLPSEGRSLVQRLARLVARDQALWREERLALAEVVRRCVVVRALPPRYDDEGARCGALLELAATTAEDDRVVRGERAYRSITDAASALLTESWEEHQEAELVLGEFATAKEVA
jgi:hypothetical protein